MLVRDHEGTIDLAELDLLQERSEITKDVETIAFV